MGKQQYELESQPIIEESISATPGAQSLGNVQMPCSVDGIMNGLGGGLLGYVFGFGRHLISTRKVAACNQAALVSAKQFAIIGGLYAAVSCFCIRIRQKQDLWNGGVSGCATGLALGWKGGPVSALQSCIGFGALSAFFDGMNKDAAQAKPLVGSDDGGSENRKTVLRCGEGGCLVPFARVLREARLHGRGGLGW
ncbi:hypothetical protein BSKO_00144 [Bryopsis sp. KO-2023]|nr:hypothetical protein BSKO_00144 [Bryopsis sp. KO-2023]